MNQEKECFSFIEKEVNPTTKEKILKILSKIEEKSNKEYWEAPNLGRFPAESEKWMMWWQNKKEHISVDFYDGENDLFWFYRSREKNQSNGSECSVETFPDEIFEKILKFRNSKSDDHE